MNKLQTNCMSSALKFCFPLHSGIDGIFASLSFHVKLDICIQENGRSENAPFVRVGTWWTLWHPCGTKGPHTTAQCCESLKIYVALTHTGSGEQVQLLWKTNKTHTFLLPEVTQLKTKANLSLQILGFPKKNYSWE